MNTLHITDAAGGMDLTPLFKAHRTDTRFVLGPGMFHFDNAWAFEAEFDHTVLGSGCELIGAGSTKTFLLAERGANIIPEKALQVEGLTAGSRSNYCPHVKIEGLSVAAVDAYQVHPDAGTIALHVWSDNAIIRDVKVSHSVGSPPVPKTQASREGFGILLNEAGRPSNGCHCGRFIVEDVIVEVFDKPNSSPNFITAFYCGLLRPDVMAVCDNIMVINNGDVPAAVAFGVNSKVLGTRWQSIGKWVRGIYCDVKGGSDVLIANSMLEVTSTALELQTGQGEVWDNIALTNSCVHFRPAASTGYCAALVLTDNAYKTKNPGKFNGVQLRDCRLLGHSYGSIPFYAGGVNTPAATDCGLVRCKRSGVRWPGANLVPGATFLDE